MAKFCTKCGKQLVEGEVCNCAQTVQPIQTTAPTTASSNSGVDVKESLMDCVNVFKNIFTKPFDAIKSFVCESKFIAGIIMVVVAALSTGLYKLAVLKNLYSSSSSAGSFNSGDLSDLISSALSGGSLSVAEPEYLKEFMTAFATNLVEYALIAVIGYLIISKLFKGTASIKQMVAAVGISLSVVLAVNLLNSVLVFIDGDFIGNLRGYLASFGSILSMLILYASVKHVAGVNENKLFVSVASMSVFATVAMDLVQKILN